MRVEVAMFNISFIVRRAWTIGLLTVGVMKVLLAPQIATARQMPTTFPRLYGHYVSIKQHPRVYETQADLKDMAKRINIPGSYSAQSFIRLANMVKADLASKTDWNATYSGCDIYIYLHAFSIEQKGGYAGQTRSDEELLAATNGRSGTTAPAGVALVAARLSLYSALVKAGAIVPADAPSPDQATAVAKHILLAWADHGFRDVSGNFRQSTGQYCVNGKPAKPVANALQIARGVLYSAQAQDLLQGISAFSPEEVQRLNRFHEGMYETVRTMSNEEFDSNVRSKTGDENYNNQFAAHLTALIAIGRLLDDQRRLEAALYGDDPALKLALPWTKLFSYVIYGVNDQPMTRITPNSSDDPLKSHPAYSTNIVAPGEINDRFRNSNPLQGIGYPIGTLGWLYLSAESLRNSGYDPYGYRGVRQQSIEMATRYYVCYASQSGFKKLITADNAKSCPDYQQYIGKQVNDVENVVVIGAYRFPQDMAITEVESAAKAALMHDPIDTARFGRWKD